MKGRVNFSYYAETQKIVWNSRGGLPLEHLQVYKLIHKKGIANICVCLQANVAFGHKEPT